MKSKSELGTVSHLELKMRDFHQPKQIAAFTKTSPLKFKEIALKKNKLAITPDPKLINRVNPQLRESLRCGFNKTDSKDSDELTQVLLKPDRCANNYVGPDHCKLNIVGDDDFEEFDQEFSNPAPSNGSKTTRIKVLQQKFENTCINTRDSRAENRYSRLISDIELI